jgi:hypothetical protein
MKRMKAVALALLGFGTVTGVPVVLVLGEIPDGFAILLPLILLVCYNLWFFAPQQAQTWRARILRGMQSGFCYLLAPIGVMVFAFNSGHYKEFPFVAAVLSGVAGFLFCLPIALILKEAMWRVQLSWYFAAAILIMVAIPQFTPMNARVAGDIMARAWVQAGFLGEKVHFPTLRFTAINETDAIVSSSAPPAMLFISARPEAPYCVGWPQAAEEMCQKKIEIYVRAYTPDSSSTP